MKEESGEMLWETEMEGQVEGHISQLEKMEVEWKKEEISNSSVWNATGSILYILLKNTHTHNIYRSYQLK